jgi:hypothetical protein
MLGQFVEHTAFDCPCRVELGSPCDEFCPQNQCLQYKQDPGSDEAETGEIREHRVAFGPYYMAGGVPDTELGGLQAVLEGE